MGLLIFIPVMLGYLLSKVLMMIFLIMLSIYLIVIIARKQKPGKFILFPIIALAVLQTLTLPIDAPSVYATGKSVLHRMKLATNNYAVMESTFDDVFEYDGKKYVLLDDYLDDMGMDSFFNNDENFNKETTLLYKSDSKPLFKLFMFSDVYFRQYNVFTTKNAPDKELLFIKNYGDTIWCTLEKFDEYKQTYADPSQYNFFITYMIDGMEKQQEINLTTFNKIVKCEEKRNNENTNYFSNVNGHTEKVTLVGVSKDARLIFEDMCKELVVIDGKLYYCYETMNEQTVGRYLNIKLQ